MKCPVHMHCLYYSLYRRSCHLCGRIGRPSAQRGARRETGRATLLPSWCVRVCVLACVHRLNLFLPHTPSSLPPSLPPSITLSHIHTQTMETRIFCEKEEGSKQFGLVDQVELHVGQFTNSTLPASSAILFQDLSTIGPRRYESKTMPAKSMGKMKRKVDSSQPSSAPKKARGSVLSVIIQLGKNVQGGSDTFHYLETEPDLNTTVAMLECSFVSSRG